MLDDPIDYPCDCGCSQQQVEQRRGVPTGTLPTSVEEQRYNQTVENSYSAEILERKDAEGRRP
jgi:hypothetical protein